MLDRDLAELYGVETFNLNKAVNRNINRFPEDFMFKLTKEEMALIFQAGISKKGRGGVRKPASVFTEQGVAMLSTVLNSERAIYVNIQIMRTFVKLKELATINTEILNRLNRHDSKLLQYDKNFDEVFKAIQCLMDLPVTIRRKTKKIGFEKGNR